jgi:hypothetical protein
MANAAPGGLITGTTSPCARMSAIARLASAITVLPAALPPPSARPRAVPSSARPTMARNGANSSRPGYVAALAGRRWAGRTGGPAEEGQGLVRSRQHPLKGRQFTAEVILWAVPRLGVRYRYDRYGVPMGPRAGSSASQGCSPRTACRARRLPINPPSPEPASAQLLLQGI